jgi:hypothetical protein
VPIPQFHYNSIWLSLDIVRQLFPCVPLDKLLFADLEFLDAGFCRCVATGYLLSCRLPWSDDDTSPLCSFDTSSVHFSSSCLQYFWRILQSVSFNCCHIDILSILSLVLMDPSVNYGRATDSITLFCISQIGRRPGHCSGLAFSAFTLLSLLQVPSDFNQLRALCSLIAIFSTFEAICSGRPRCNSIGELRALCLRFSASLHKAPSATVHVKKPLFVLTSDDSSSLKHGSMPYLRKFARRFYDFLRQPQAESFKCY